MSTQGFPEADRRAVLLQVQAVGKGAVAFVQNDQLPSFLGAHHHVPKVQLLLLGLRAEVGGPGAV